MKKINVNPFKPFTIKKIVALAVILTITFSSIIYSYITKYTHNISYENSLLKTDSASISTGTKASNINNPNMDCLSITGDTAYNSVSEEYCIAPEDPIIMKTSKSAENEFIKTKTNPISTFSSDIDTASYITFRQLIKNGCTLTDLQNNSTFRTEEMVNYFTYKYTNPQGTDIFGITTEVGYCPWNTKNKLLRVGIKAKEINMSKRTPLNLVFLVDVSGSMSDNEKLPLFKKTFASLINKLNENDKISIVTYSSGTEVVLNGVSGSDKQTLLEKVNSLVATGGTNGGEGLKLAYKTAKKHFKKGANNRILLSTDGDLNLGMTSTEELKNYISEERNQGIYLSVLGFGNTSYNDEITETLADNGDGNYSIIDTLSEAKRVLENEFMGTLYTVAKDVKFQMNFDSKYIDSYRLIGYENRMMNTEDFEDDTKDAGDIGSGQALTILYELTPCSNNDLSSSSAIALNIKYKDPISNKNQKSSYNINSNVTEQLSDDFKFISALVETSMLLNNSKYLNKTTLDSIYQHLNEIKLDKEHMELKYLIKQLKANTSSYESYVNKRYID